MRQIEDQLWRRIRNALHARFEGQSDNRLPQRWVDLINHLNDKERDERATRARAQAKAQPRGPRRRWL